MMRRFTILFVFVSLWGVLSLQAQDTQPPFEVITAENADRVEQVVFGNARSAIIQVAWSPDGDYVAVVQGSDIFFVEIWRLEIEEGEIELTRFATIEPRYVQYVDWMPDSQSVVTYSQTPVDVTYGLLVQRWNVNGELLHVVQDEFFNPMNCCDPTGYPTIGWTSDYDVSAKISDNFTLRFSDRRDFSYLMPESLFSDNFVNMPNSGTIAGLLWSPNNQYFTVFRVDDMPSFDFQLVNFISLEVIHFIDGEDDRMCNAWWSPDETTFAIASSDFSVGSGYSTYIRFYRLDEAVVYGDGERRLWFDEIDGYWSVCTAALDWSRDSSIAMIGTDSGVQLYDVETLSQIGTISQDPTSALSLHPSGRFLVTGDPNGSLRIWGVPSDEE